MRASFHLIFLFVFCVSGVLAENLPHANIDAKQVDSGEPLYLNGQWWFHFGEHLSVEQIEERILNKTLSTIDVPNTWNEAVAKISDVPYQHGIATFVLPLSLSEKPSSHMSLLVKYVGGGYRILWQPNDIFESSEIIATSGDWQYGQYSSAEAQSFPFDIDSDGLLIVYVAKSNVFKGGIRQPILIQQRDVLQQKMLLDWLVRSLLIGAMLIMGLHYFVQYFYSSRTKSALFIALVCFVAVIRSMCTAGMMDLLLSYLTPYHYNYRIRFEYLTLLYAPYTFFLFFNAMVPKVIPAIVAKLALSITLLLTLSMVVFPLAKVTQLLPVYQLYLLSWVAIVGFYTFVSAVKNLPYSRLMFASTFVVIFGTVNDIIASRSATYNIMLVEYALFVFLFLQALLVGHQLRAGMHDAIRLFAEKKLLEKGLTKAVLASQQDHLTGLYNRLALNDRIQQFETDENFRDQTMGVILFDIDHFKNVNDAHGHDVGDEILVFIASLLHGHALRNSDFKCRYGGEEFLLILPGSNLMHTTEVADSIRKRIEASVAYAHEETEICITASFGVSVYEPAELIEFKEVITQADQALYRAKRSGRNRVETFLGLTNA